MVDVRVAGLYDGRGGTGEDPRRASLRGADALYAHAPAPATNACDLRDEPEHRDGDRGLLPAPPARYPPAPCPQPADAPRLPRRVGRPAHAEDTRPPAPDGPY